MNINIRDVAARAGVSVGTVSNVLNRPEKVADNTVERVSRAVSELGFIRNDAARQLRAGSSKAIGLVVLDIGNPFFSDLARGAEQRAALTGHSIILGNSDEKVEREARYLDLFEEQRMHGVLISPFGEIESRLERLRQRGTPAVLVDRDSTPGVFSSVSVDDVAGGELALEHLVALGRKRIVYVCGPHEIRQVTDRLDGAKRVVARYPGVTLELITRPALSVREGQEAARLILDRPRSARPDAVFAANDLIALGVLHRLVIDGTVRVPDDIAIVGYDDIDFASAAVHPLSSVRQPSALIGETAVQLLLEEAEEPGLKKRQILFQPELMVRASSVG